MEQNEAVKDTTQPDIGVGKEIILLIYEHNVSQCSWPNLAYLAIVTRWTSVTWAMGTRLLRMRKKRCCQAAWTLGMTLEGGWCLDGKKTIKEDRKLKQLQYSLD